MGYDVVNVCDDVPKEKLYKPLTRMSNENEPHKLRRTEILKKYPEIRGLMGHDPHTKWICFVIVFFQMFLSISLHNTNTITYILTMYFMGATMTQSLFLAVHESSHNLIFKSSYGNKLFSLFLNIPIVIPFSIAFRHYHLDHHKHQGVDGIDTDLPTNLEVLLVTNSFTKFLWMSFQIVVYALRPIIYSNNPIKYSLILFLNILFQLSINFLILYFYGLKPLVYLLLCVLVAGGLHPCAGHFLSEHYNFTDVDQETFSYYGKLNILTWNVGYHNEHHDFPFIPGSRLPILKKIAPEFYNNLVTCDSWSFSIYNYITDQKMGPFCRVKRKK